MTTSGPGSGKRLLVGATVAAAVIGTAGCGSESTIEQGTQAAEQAQQQGERIESNQRAIEEAARLTP